MDPIHQHISGSFLRRAQQFRAITRRIRLLLPTQFVNEAEVIHADRERITLGVSSPAVANQLRYYLPKLQYQFGEQQLTIKVIPPRLSNIEPAPQKSSGPPPISANTQRYLQQAAQQIKDPELKKAMQRLAQHGPVNQKPE
ncbi:conserved hypothetical protein [gamma proteobacterium HTCC5015]|nr:conserved hypothetical protein [gamma proteobacterium HTCC5015]